MGQENNSLAIETFTTLRVHQMFSRIQQLQRNCIHEKIWCFGRGYLGPKKDKHTKKNQWSSEHPVATGRQ